jgi:hypothetical protein
MPYDGFVGSELTGATTLTLRGSDFTGADGAANRTYSLPSGASEEGILIIIDNLALHKTSQWTISSGTITIIDPLDDASYIEILYFS